MNAIHPSNRAVTLALIASLCFVSTPATSRAQTAAPEGPLPPPADAPESRLTASPTEIEQWLAGLAPGTEPAEAEGPEPVPSLVTPPPPPPSLVAPPPAPPMLVAPPAPAKITPVPAMTGETEPAAPAAPPVPAAPQPESPTLTAPPAPSLQQPEEPRLATLPPDSTVTTPPEPTVEPQARPEELKIFYQEGAMELPETAKPDLDRMAAWLKQNPAARMQVASYASGENKAGSLARRTSLYRALAVRKYLADIGVLSTRVTLCAFGSKTAKLPRDRVELLPLLDVPAQDCDTLRETREAR